MKIIEELKLAEICVTEMRDGEIAIITQHTIKRYEGRIVQRFSNKLITLGETTEYSFDHVFMGYTMNKFRVRILPKGTKLEI